MRQVLCFDRYLDELRLIKANAPTCVDTINAKLAAAAQCSGLEQQTWAKRTQFELVAETVDRTDDVCEKSQSLNVLLK
jgi:hypothetical protein